MGSSRSAKSCRSPLDLPRPCAPAARSGEAVGARQAGRCPEDRGSARVRGELLRRWRAQGLAAAQREGFDVARCTVSRLMHDMGLQGVIRGESVRTTVSDKAAPCPLDRVNRQFKAPRPNVLWLSDFNYVATWTGFVYVAFVMPMPAGSWAGGPRARRARASSSMRWSRHYTIGGRSIAVGSCTTATATAAAKASLSRVYRAPG